MDTTNNVSEDSKEPVINVIQKLKDGLLCTKDIDEETRIECVHRLRLEEYTVPQIAQLFKLSDRQIQRYTQKVRERNALVINERFAPEFLGDIVQRVLNICSNMIRTARAKGTPPAEQFQGQALAGKLLLDLAKLLQSTGALPLQPQVINANVSHHVNNNFSEQDILEIEAVAKLTVGLNPELSKVLEDIKTVVTPQKAQETKEAGNGPKTDQ